MRLRWCIHQKEKSTAGRKIRQFNFQLRARSKAVGGSTRLIERARLPSSRRRFVFPFVPKGRGGGGAFDSSRKRKKEISSSINRFRPTDETVDGTIRIEITPYLPCRRRYRDNLQSRAGVFTVTSVQRATEAAVHAGFMRCLHSRKAANTAFRQQPRSTSQPLHRVSLFESETSVCTLVPANPLYCPTVGAIQRFQLLPEHRREKPALPRKMIHDVWAYRTYDR